MDRCLCPHRIPHVIVTYVIVTHVIVTRVLVTYVIVTHVIVTHVIVTHVRIAQVVNVINMVLNTTSALIVRVIMHEHILIDIAGDALQGRLIVNSVRTHIIKLLSSRQALGHTVTHP